MGRRNNLMMQFSFLCHPKKNQLEKIEPDKIMFVYVEDDKIQL